ncbi:MAG: HD-GYP domain-containing protein [Acidimicrobiales bacterium]
MDSYAEQQVLHPQHSWQRRPALARLLRYSIAVVPIVASVGVAISIELLVEEPTSAVGKIAWWIGVLATTTVVMLAVEKAARRALPLAALLAMGMLFPEAAPKRLAVARRAASTRGLERSIDEARTNGSSDEPVQAAERIVALAASLSAHDRKTRGHTERVRALTDMIAEELRLSEADKDKLRWAALLHDVGKLTVHPEVLNKDGRLSEEEWEMIRQHPLEGAVLTAPLADWLGEWSSTIAEHHERYDGAGYPFGLSGESISLGGRIVAVADTYDVMTSLRSYKAPCSPEAARIELARCAGTQFDPEIVRAFLAVPVRRLRGLLPLSWLGTIPFADSGEGFAVLGKAFAGLIALGSIVGVTALHGGRSGPANATQASSYSSGQKSSAVESIGTIGSTLAHLAGGRGTSTTQAGRSGGGSFTTNGTKHGSGRNAGGIPGSTSSTGASFGMGDGTTASGPSTTFFDVPGTIGDGVPTTIPGTTTSTSSGLTTTTTSHHGGSSTTTTTTTPPSTTTTTIPPPAAPTEVKADGVCQAIILIPKVTISWKLSTSSWVTGYFVLVSSSQTGTYAATTSSPLGSGTTSYQDNNVNTLGATYWFKVEAVSPDGDNTSAPISTPDPCLL